MQLNFRQSGKMMYTHTPSNPEFQSSGLMIRSLSKYDYTCLSIPRTSDEIRPMFTKLLKSQAPAILTEDHILSVHLGRLVNPKGPYLQTALGNTGIWKYIARQMESLDRESELVPGLEGKQPQELKESLAQAFQALDATSPVPVTGEGTLETPWSAPGDSHRMYRFSWETGRDLPLLIDFFHAAVYYYVVYYRCRKFAPVGDALDRLLASPTVENFVEKFSIDVHLHLRVYLLFAASSYFRNYCDDHSPRDVIQGFLSIWHEGLRS